MKDDFNTNSHYLCIFALEGWENVLFELRSERGNQRASKYCLFNVLNTTPGLSWAVNLVRSERSSGSYFLGPGKTRPHCGGNIVSCDVARPWQNAATLSRAARTQQTFLKIFRNILCVQDSKFASDTNVARVAKRLNIWETWSRQQCCRHNVSSFCQGLTQDKSWFAWLRPFAIGP